MNIVEEIDPVNVNNIRNIVGNPDKEESKIEEKKCFRCKRLFIIAGQPYRERDINNNLTGHKICPSCYQKYNPNSQHNFVKSLADHRTGSLKYSNHILGDNCEELTAKWLGAERLATKYDKYGLPLDHGSITEHISVLINDKLLDLYGKIPQTKGKTYDPRCKAYNFGRIVNEWFKEFDILILYCISRDGKKVERIYIIPKDEIIVSGIYIAKNPTNSHGEQTTGKYDKYRITNKDELKIINEKWQNIITEKR